MRDALVLFLWARRCELFVSGCPHRHGREHDLSELLEPLLLFLDQELGVTNNVDEQDMPDLEVKIIVGFQRHHLSVS